MLVLVLLVCIDGMTVVVWRGSMASGRPYKTRDYAFADRALALRKQAGLTQRDLAAILGVSDQSIHAWEAGLSYPAAEHLAGLIAVYVERGAFETGWQEAGAVALWEGVREKAARRMPPFDPAWFASLAHAAGAAVEYAPTNIRPARTTFVGRAADLVDLARELDPTGAGAHLLTLSGVAGCGKTRVALAAADIVRDRYAEGAWLVELAMLPPSTSADPAPVAAAALTVLGVPEQPDHTLLDTLVAQLRAKRLLLVLDNCEHVAAACAALTTYLLSACPALRILATSQRPLGTVEEVVRPVTPFAVPPLMVDASTLAALEALAQSDAVRLFIERARDVQPGFALNAENAATVVAICRHLDGLPLAIELAAARLHVLPVAEIVVRLDDRFQLLRRGGRDAPDRHHALQATLDWSYGLLDPAGQALLRRLTVFAGGWDVAAAETVCAGDGVSAQPVLEVLDELLDRSLVYVYEEGGEPRYGMLETVRQYGAQHLDRAGETGALRDRHLAWCVTLTEQAAPGPLGSVELVWLARLDREHDNLRAALRWALKRGPEAAGRGLRMVAGLWQYWRYRGHLSEGRRWSTALLALTAEDAAADAASLAVRVTALEGAAWLAEDQHDFAEAAALFAQSAELRRIAGEDERLSGPVINRAMEARAAGDYARAAILLEEGMAQQRAVGHRDAFMRGGLGLSLARLALVLREQGAYARATALYEECLALNRELGDWEGVATALLGLSDSARDQGDAVRARAYGEECLALFQEYGLQWAIGFSLNNLAQAAYLDGDLALAARHAMDSEALFRDLRAGPSRAEALVTLGRIKAAQGDSVAARAHLAEALTLAWTGGPRVVAAAALDELAVLAGRRDQAGYAVQLLSAAARLRQEMGAPIRPADRPAIEGALAAARATLGDAYAAAWTAGQTVPLEPLVARLSATPEEGMARTERRSLLSIAGSGDTRPCTPDADCDDDATDSSATGERVDRRPGAFPVVR